MSLASNVPRISTHLDDFGTGADRYNPGGYKPPVSPEERIAMAAGTKHLTGVELHYSVIFNEIGPEEMQQILVLSMARADSVRACQHSVDTIRHP